MKIKKKYYKRLEETIYEGTHNSGLKSFVFPKKNFSKKYAFFMTKYGSIYNSFIDESGNVVDKPSGIAHFLEHKIFEEDKGNIFEKFALLGANVNAYTKFDSTTYNFSTVDNFYKSLELLLNFVQSPFITKENVKKEKGIIEQEIKMYMDNPDWKVYFNALRAMYHFNDVREDIAGTIESIEKITASDLNQCYEYFYSPENMIVFVIGDVNVDKVFETVEKSLKKEFLNRKYTPQIDFKKEPAKVLEEKVVDTMDVSQPKFIFGFKDVRKYDSRELFKRALAIKIALINFFGVSSSFYEKMYEKGLIDESFSTEHSFNKYYIHTIIGGESDNPEKLKEYLLKDIEKIKKSKFDSNELIRIKRKFIGRFIASFNSLQSIASIFTNYYVKDIDCFEYLDILESIEPEYIKKVFIDHFNTENIVLSVIKEKE